MGIQSTMNVSRQWAIDRIKRIVSLKREHDYRAIEAITSEVEHTVQDFVDYTVAIDAYYIEKWTNTMLENALDRPFYRESHFYNHVVVDNPENEKEQEKSIWKNVACGE